MKLGLDIYGAINYRKVIRQAWPKGYAAGVLIKTRGPKGHWDLGWPVIDTLAKVDCPIQRVSGLWDDYHHFVEADIKVAVRIAKRLACYSEKYPHIKFYFQPFLEPHISDKLMRKCRRECKKVLPRSIPVVCGHPLKKGLAEVHHGPAIRSPYIFSFDGKDMMHSNVPYWRNMHKGARLFFGWTVSLNGLKSLTDNTPRHERTNWPTAVDLKIYALELGRN